MSVPSALPRPEAATERSTTSAGTPVATTDRRGQEKRVRAEQQRRLRIQVLRVGLAVALLGSWEVLRPDGDPDAAEIAVSPAQRSAQVYVLERSKRSRLIPRLVLLSAKARQSPAKKSRCSNCAANSTLPIVSST